MTPVLAQSTPAVELRPILPELILVSTGIALLLGAVIARRAEAVTLLLLGLAGVVAAGVAAVGLWDWDGDLTVLGGAVAVDRFGVVVRLIILAVTAIGMVLGYHYFERSGETRSEFYPLMLFAASGMTLFAVSADLITAFLALEILSLSLYVLTGLSNRLGSIEGAMKYFLLGAFSSAVLLYGISLIYGALGTTNLIAIGEILARGEGTGKIGRAHV